MPRTSLLSASTASAAVCEVTASSSPAGTPSCSTTARAEASCASASSSTKRREPETVSSAADLGELGVGEVAPDVRADPGPLRGAAGVGQQRRLLARAQVAGRALAGPRGVAEDPEEVVEQLEAGPQHPPGLAEPAHRDLVARRRAARRPAAAARRSRRRSSARPSRGSPAATRSRRPARAARRRAPRPRSCGGRRRRGPAAAARPRSGRPGGDRTDRRGQREVAGEDPGGPAEGLGVPGVGPVGQAPGRGRCRSR